MYNIYKNLKIKSELDKVFFLAVVIIVSLELIMEANENDVGRFPIKK